MEGLVGSFAQLFLGSEEISFIATEKKRHSVCADSESATSISSHVWREENIATELTVQFRHE